MKSSLLTNHLDDSFESGSAKSDSLTSAKILPRPRILLVEDYKANVLVATTYLDSFGYEYEVASNGLEALTKIKQQEFTAVLMDVEMHEMDGLSATKGVREYEETIGRRTYIIGMTAHAMPGDKERCLAAGMDDYISKPFNPDNLQKKLSEATQK